MSNNQLLAWVCVVIGGLGWAVSVTLALQTPVKGWWKNPKYWFWVLVAVVFSIFFWVGLDGIHG